MQLICLGFFFLCNQILLGAAREGFPEWDAEPWIIRDTGQNMINIPCTHKEYFPFNETLVLGGTIIKKIVWILPRSASYLHLETGKEQEGWKVNDNFSLTIDRSNLNVENSVNGMYVCAVLAVVNATANEHAWFYLRWGVGLYTNVPAMNEGGIERYNHNFLVAGIALLVYAVIAVGFSLTVAFRNKDKPEDDLVERTRREHNVYDDSMDKGSELDLKRNSDNVDVYF